MVKYTRGYTPLCLVEEKAQNAFEKDCEKNKYVDTNSRYKCKSQKDGDKLYPVSSALKDIYKNKCAYCETHFNQSFIKIEHYRPKSVYYEFAYSWSNLLPICDICNTTKSNNFKIYGTRIHHSNRTLKKMQYSTKVYNRIEKPLFLHPEIDEYSNLFRFNIKGKIVVYNSLIMNYTIKYSNLNNSDLMVRRAKVLQDFITIRDELFYLFYLAKKHKDKEELDEFKKRTNEKIKSFFNDENEFLAVRKFIIERLRFYLMSKDKIFVKFFKGYLHKYIKNIAVYNN